MSDEDKTRRIPKSAGFVNLSKLPKGPFGRALCRRCGDEVPVGCRSFCSDDCVHEWKVRSNPGYAAAQVLKRDAGVCALCGLDCLKLLAELRHLRKAMRQARWGEAQGAHLGERTLPHELLAGMFLERCEALGLPPHLRDLVRRLWEMDHTTPVVEGGGSVGLEGLRTLCWLCHRNETAALRKRMAERKKAAKQA